MTRHEMPCAKNVGPEWGDPLLDVEHWCSGLHGPGRTYPTDPVSLNYVLTTRAAGIEVARCERCREAWVRRV